MSMSSLVVRALIACSVVTAPLAAQVWTSADVLPTPRTFAGATSSCGKAFFAGGGHPFVGYEATVDIYDSALGVPTDPAAWSTDFLSQARAGVAATSVGGKVLFAGGNHQGFSQPVSDVVDIYDCATGLWSMATLSEARTADTATSVAGYALFGGGDPNTLGDPGPPSDRVDVYEAATGLWTQASLSVPRLGVQATTVGPYALFAGGVLFTFGDLSDVVDVYDSTVGPPSDPAAWSAVSLPEPRLIAAATTAGGKAFLAAGLAYVAPGVTEDVATVHVYDSCVGPPSDPAAWSVEQLGQARNVLAATSLGTEALFAGGTEVLPDFTTADVDAVDVYDTATGTWSTGTLSVARLPQATTVGSYALFAGGHDWVNWIFTPYGVVDARQAKGGSWYVDAGATGPADGSPGAPFATIQEGIDAAQPGDTVLVGPGTYAENLTVTQDLSLVSTCGRDATTLTPPGGQSGILTMNAAFVLDGFTISGAQGPQGGGLYIAGGDVRVEGCHFRLCVGGNLMSGGEGGAIYVASGTLEVHGTIFERNAAGALVGSVGRGGAIYGSPLVRNCEFYDNVADGSPLTWGGSAIYGNPRIENSLFVLNGGSCLKPAVMGTTEILDSTFVDNGSIGAAGTLTCRNSIFWVTNMGSAPGFGGPGTTVDIQHCIVRGGYPGTGNLDMDPQFVVPTPSPLPDFTDLRLRPGSPAIDAGDNGAVPGGTITDLAGRPRFRDDPATPDTGLGPAPVVDIGAHEFQPRPDLKWEVGRSPVVAPDPQ